MPLSVILLKEYEKKTLADIQSEFNAELNNDDLTKITKYLEKSNFSSALKIGSNSIKARSWVGIIKYKNIQIQILPKLISENSESEVILNNLLYMLSYTKKLDIKTSDSAKLSKTDNPFLEVLIREFANSLFNCLKRLTPKNYIREEDNLNYLKGKLKFTENIRYNCANKAKFYCEYDEFSENNILNQLFLYVSTCLYSISKDNKNKSLLKFIIDYFCEVKLIRFDKCKCNKICLTRQQQMFVKPFTLAKMFLENSSVDLSKNRIENITLLWDMNKLFEEFVYELIKHNKIDGVKKAEAQKCKRLLSDNNSTRRDTKIDILITKDDDSKIILDTKYKKFESFENVSSSDIYQVMTYCLLHDEKVGTETNNSAILLYPKYKRNSEAPDKIGYKLNSEIKSYSIDLRTIDLMYDDIKKKEKEIISNLKKIIYPLSENDTVE